MAFVEPPVDVGVDVDFASEISCGPFAENVFDIFLPGAGRETPMVVFVHGGGFTGGVRRELWENEYTLADLRLLLAANIPVATIGYRVLDPDVDMEGVIKPLTDIRTCIQFLRHHAENSFDADPARIGLMGVSAGAGASSWLATHDEMADPTADDAALRESSRPTAIAIYETQSTYDLVRWTDEVLAEYELDFFEAAAFLGVEQQLLNFYGITDVALMDSPEIIAYRQDVDMLRLMSGDDAPMWVRNDIERDAFPGSTGSMFHHPLHAKALHDAAIANGVESVAFIPEIDIVDPSGETGGAFLLRQLTK